ncbi:MAG: hypothetical protein CEN89_312 [Candidatus Berkelbacteria bacterium Licking1014_7]|uniref:Uncharacterized protein n=1 Tax=Candidatus Berkelbacteria bacterium Licking1014_7 TaxID=2017147 RepID=A0A554LJN1_9BACT|nr:MAG: hypothetical protein CEN89_312 [Candidatus Berkelbacteria bacterium Licking1014_7]
MDKRKQKKTLSPTNLLTKKPKTENSHVQRWLGFVREDRCKKSGYDSQSPLFVSYPS